MNKVILSEKDKCTGCLACFNVCSHDAVAVKEERGFLVPSIINDKCVDCGLCRKVCPVLHPVSKFSPHNDVAYAVFNMSKEIRDTSSSGGVFYSIAEWIINDCGVVYGAAFDSQLYVHHIRVSNIDDIRKLQGSKYVQSNIDGCLRQVREDLRNGLVVLFSGVPCQIAGLKNFLGKDYENLYTCEVICHGSASPIAFREHLKYVGQKANSKVIGVNFRYKTEEKCQNLLYQFADGTSQLLNQPMDDLFYRSFLGGALLRKSCFKCQYIGTERCADITLADFWGINKNAVDYPDKKSFASLVLVNTEKGGKIFDINKAKLFVYERPMFEAINGQLALKRPIPYTKWNRRFFDELDLYGYQQAANHCLSEHFNVKEFVKKILGKRLTRFMLKLLNR